MLTLPNSKINLLYQDNISNTNYRENTFNERMNNQEIFSESMSLILFTASVSFYGAGNFHMKYIQMSNPSEYDMFSFIFWRNLVFVSIVYMLIRNKNIEILDARKLSKNSQMWLCVRSFGQFLALIFTLCSLEKLRVSTANTFISMYPAVVILLSTFLLKERFHWRYPIGVVVCFFGVLLMISNEIKPKQSLSGKAGEQQVDSTSNTLIGLFWGFCNLFCVASLAVSTKALNNDNFNQENICLYVGANNLICTSIVIVFIKMHFSYGFYFVMSSVFNAIMYFFATYFYIVSLKRVDLLKTTSLIYVQTIVSAFLGVIFLGESLYFTDILGSLIILGLNIYNVLYPVKFLAS